jgi:putative tricarboxylic transport membrane protein
VWAKLLQLPRPYLYAGILFFATLGAYSVNLQAFDLVILLVLGALGFMMRRFGLPVLPLILGVILGPRIEGQLRRTLQLFAGDPAGLWSEPIAVVVYIIVAIVILWPLLFKLVRRNRPVPASVVPAHASEVLLKEDAAIRADENSTQIHHTSHHSKEKP